MFMGGESTTEQVVSLALGVAPSDDPLCLVVGSGPGEQLHAHPRAGSVDPRGLVGPAFDVRYVESTDALADWLVGPEAQPLDCTVVIPPWGTRRSDGHDDIRVALRAVASLAQDFPVGILVPQLWLASRQSRPAESEVIRHQLRTVVFFDNSDGVLADVSRHLRMALLVLGEAEPAQQLLRMFRVPSSDSAAGVEVIDDFRRLQRRKGGRGRWGYVRREPVDVDAPLTFERYDPRIRERSEEIGTLGGSSTVDGLFETLVSTVRAPRNASGPRDGMIGVVSGGSLTGEGRVDLDEIRYIDRDPQFPTLQAGDICLRRIRASPEHLVHACVIAEELTDQLTWDSDVVVLRPREQVFLGDPSYFAEFLNSQRATELLSIGGPGHQVSLGVLRSLPLPPMDEPLQATLQELRRTAQQFREWADQADVIREDVFGESSLDEARHRALSYSQRVRQRRLAASRLDDLGVRIRTQFPHPLAFRWRTVEAHRPDRDGYLAVLEATEVVLCYAAMVGVVSARANSIEVAAVAELAQRLRSRRSGTLLGDWLGILRELTGAKMQQLPSDAPLCRVREVLADDRYDEAVKRLTERRNDQAHLRRIGDHEIGNAFRSALDDLAALLEGAECLADYRLRLVEQVSLDSIEGLNHLECRDLIGDHPIVPLTRLTTTDLSIERGSLYLVAQDESMHLLRPFLTARLCPECGNRSIFHLDTVGDATCNLKSLEHGHVVAAPDDLASFEAVGLVASV